MSELLLDRAGRRRSPVTMPGFHAGRPRRQARRWRPSVRRPPTRPDRAVVASKLRIHEALGLNERDLDQRRGSLLVRHGKGGRRREVGLDTRSCGARLPRPVFGAASRYRAAPGPFAS
jgi:integrase